MYRRSSAATSTIAAAVPATMLCGSNSTFDSSWIVTVVNLTQLAKALLPIDVTLSGMLIEVNPAHPSKALMPIDVTPSGMLIEVNPAHS